MGGRPIIFSASIVLLLADPLFFVRLFGHVLGHAGWDHFIGNMLLFLVIAPPLEERYGGIPITLFLVGALYLSQQVYDILFVQDNVANLCTSSAAPAALCLVLPCAENNTRRFPS